MSKDAFNVYHETMAQAKKIYEDAIAPALKAYEETKAQALKVYREAEDLDDAEVLEEDLKGTEAEG